MIQQGQPVAKDESGIGPHCGPVHSGLRGVEQGASESRNNLARGRADAARPGLLIARVLLNLQLGGCEVRRIRADQEIDSP
jgi:hypothetical protein